MGGRWHATVMNVSGGRRNTLTGRGKRSPIVYSYGYKQRWQHEERQTQLSPLAWGSQPREPAAQTPRGWVPVCMVTSRIASTDAATVGTSTTVFSSAVKSTKRALNRHRQTPSLDGYDDDLCTHLTLGYQLGFRFHSTFKSPPTTTVPRNHQSALSNPTAMDDKLAAELAASRIEGPFASPPLPLMVFSPLGLVPKKEPGKFRIIHDLSYPKLIKNPNTVNSIILFCLRRIKTRCS